MAALIFRLNLPALQVVNYAVYPLQLALLIPFVRMGGWLFQTGPASSPLAALVTATLSTALAWFCVCAPVGLALYFVLAQGGAAQWIIKIGKVRKSECPNNTATSLTRQVQAARIA